MVQQQFDIPLHDIKPLVPIEEYSFTYLVTLSTLAVLIISALLYLLIRWFLKRNRFSLRKEHLKILTELDLGKTKESAYALTRYGETFKNDTPRHQVAYKEMFEALTPYKYKKEVADFDTQTMHFIEIYQGMLDA